MEITDNHRQLKAYVCPCCRMVFKFPSDPKDEGFGCPGCRRLLRIPPPNINSSSHIPVSRNPSEREKIIRKYRKKNKPQNSITWENEKDTQKTHREKISAWHYLILAFSVSAIACLLAWIVLQNDKIEKQVNPVSIKPVSQPSAIQNMQSSGPNPEQVFIADAEKLARKFVSAKKVEELNDIVRNPDQTIPRILKLHPEGILKTIGILAFNPNQEIVKFGDFTSVSMRTTDYELRAMNFESTPQGLRIDWESWEGWNEMSWEEFMTKRPTKGTVFRVKINRTNYYNFDFSNESKWNSFSLTSRDNNNQIYGYVDRYSKMKFDLASSDDLTRNLFTLSLKFPENSKTNNQVIIEQILFKGWIDSEKFKP